MSERRLSFQEFCDNVKAGIQDYLPDAFRDAEIRTADFRKLNENYVGMTVRREEEAVVPNINLNQQYEQYMVNGEDLAQVLRRIADQAQLHPELDTDWLRDYGKVKDRLFIRVSNEKENEEFLSNVPHQTVDGLAVTYHVAIDGIHGVNASTAVTNDMLEMYGVSKEQLHQDALDNAREMLPARYTSMAAMMMGIASDMGMDTDMMQESHPGMPMLMVLTNDTGAYGAAALFYPDKLDEISSGMHSDFFVLPSSVHEVLILPDDGRTDYRDLQMMVQTINESEVAPADRLSDHVYHYDAKDHVLEKAETYEHRMELKSQAAEKEKISDREKEPPKGRQSVLQRLNEKKAQVKVQPKKDVPDRAKGFSID